ncbi:MAG: HD-GYP domain-containing protein [Syntrophomonadaceae bacterium]|nr:HD-GYP domain-containing protein [Syntrophomonadaceae bacterium]MDD4549071.1 HD-GYP domain-containing protein [Syntrophomonadaceae bacterium]
MRRIYVNKLKPGMIVARSVFNSEGRVLLQDGIVLNKIFINRLQELGISSIYINDEIFGEIEVPDIVSEETRRATVRLIKENFVHLEQDRKLNIRAVRKMVDTIIDELISNMNVLISLSDIRAFDDYTFAHSVNVCILSIMTGITAGYNDLQLKELGIGALLHDIGKINIDKAILNKPGELNKEEFAEVKRHTVYGFNILRQYDDVPLLSAHVALQHHERWDGNGYPRQLAGENIHEYARIVAVADVYDALLADRPYRSSYSVTQTLIILKRMCDIYLDSRFVTALISNIAIYPIGSIVQLNTGNIGIVVDVNKQQPTRPVIKIVYDSNSRRLCHPHEVDLTKLPTIVVSRSLSEEDIEDLHA